ncbi:MAG: hypothetical protein MZU84_07490 [Sphingobacterium sp.]|nr:hypothetical protein [Sphingobacterium sp.]
MLVILPWVSKWFFKRLQDESGLQYVYVLLVLFTSGFIAQISGIEPIIEHSLPALP